MNIVIYSKQSCKYCTTAKDLFKDRSLVYTEYDIEQDSTKRQFLIDNGFKTLPQIYIDGIHIGGYREILQHFNNKETI